MTSGRGGEFTTMSATGVPFVQIGRRRGRLRTQGRRFAIFGKLEQDYTTTVRATIAPSPRRDGRFRRRTRLKEMADRDRTC